MKTFREDLRAIAPMAVGILLCAYGVGELRSWLVTLPADHFANGVAEGLKMFFGLTPRGCQ